MVTPLRPLLGGMLSCCCFTCGMRGEEGAAGLNIYVKEHEAVLRQFNRNSYDTCHFYSCRVRHCNAAVMCSSTLVVVEASIFVHQLSLGKQYFSRLFDYLESKIYSSLM